ncbi:isoprenoid biosynthesis glyoxalase ElbB [Neptuniibacter sp. CAU 1671]|uniref:isoprenoid biosynthesis glyoxalase ElbB n=1 Tax=Neptuniibacter sp. CAU 1671 TaxID=3032593 RepID=UPI0023DB7D62|nr:isoprenoid biosynthesis glyoxalase ElbB [Neptuniibacter sp. CAU 1671]MDF2182440.1 isoprenoid biosynthesis glyoxalase ElbB [Neptuniibacter sp. CAU 1671]
MKKIAVILSGCGVYDGSEIYEAVLTLLHLSRTGVAYQCMAPDIEQLHVINHHTGEPVEGEVRNVLQESARLARGEIISLADANPEDYDGLIIPGGFGAAKNLSDFALQGGDAQANPDVVAFSRAMHEAGKPIGLICIAPALTPLLIGKGVTCTIGNDTGVASAIEQMGGKHKNCPVNDIVIDAAHRVVTTPAYMLAGSITEVDAGIARLVQAMVDLL